MIGFFMFVHFFHIFSHFLFHVLSLFFIRHVLLPSRSFLHVTTAFHHILVSSSLSRNFYFMAWLAFLTFFPTFFFMFLFLYVVIVFFSRSYYCDFTFCHDWLLVYDLDLKEVYVTFSPWWINSHSFSRYFFMFLFFYKSQLYFSHISLSWFNFFSILVAFIWTELKRSIRNILSVIN